MALKPSLTQPHLHFQPVSHFSTSESTRHALPAVPLTNPASPLHLCFTQPHHQHPLFLSLPTEILRILVTVTSCTVSSLKLSQS